MMQRAGCAVMILMATACATGSPGARLLMPKVTVERIVGLGGDSHGVTVRALVRVVNPNVFPIRLSKVTYDVVLDQRVTGHGETLSNVSVPALGNALVPVVMRAPLREALSAGAVLLLMGEVPYELRLNAFLWTPIKDVVVPFSDSGTFKMDDLLHALPPLSVR